MDAKIDSRFVDSMKDESLLPPHDSLKKCLQSATVFSMAPLLALKTQLSRENVFKASDTDTVIHLHWSDSYGACLNLYARYLLKTSFCFWCGVLFQLRAAQIHKHNWEKEVRVKHDGHNEKTWEKVAISTLEKMLPFTRKVFSFLRSKTIHRGTAQMNPRKPTVSLKTRSNCFYVGL